ncbi:phosphatase PAP2 family protein, partial [Clostridioides difficile]|uniref:phosphatase PAP2 family protein n=1 Tax=Clostridioides difficile TaxID=1496 RepID=UPI002FD09B28
MSRLYLAVHWPIDVIVGLDVGIFFTVIFGAVMVLGVGLSRLYLAVHWPIDVIVGLDVGIFFTVIF